MLGLRKSRLPTAKFRVAKIKTKKAGKILTFLLLAQKKSKQKKRAFAPLLSHHATRRGRRTSMCAGLHRPAIFLSNVESKIGNVAILHYVIFAFKADKSFVAGGVD